MNSGYLTKVSFCRVVSDTFFGRRMLDSTIGSAVGWEGDVTKHCRNKFLHPNSFSANVRAFQLFLPSTATGVTASGGGVGGGAGYVGGGCSGE